jgi:hypothetical protein
VHQTHGRLHCKNCNHDLGAEVRDGSLYAGDVRLFGAVIICPQCGRQRAWYAAQKPSKAHHANAPPKAHSGA